MVELYGARLQLEPQGVVLQHVRQIGARLECLAHGDTGVGLSEAAGEAQCRVYCLASCLEPSHEAMRGLWRALAVPGALPPGVLQDAW